MTQGPTAPITVTVDCPKCGVTLTFRFPPDDPTPLEQAALAAARRGDPAVLAELNALKPRMLEAHWQGETGAPCTPPPTPRSRRRR